MSPWSVEVIGSRRYDRARLGKRDIQDSGNLPHGQGDEVGGVGLPPVRMRREEGGVRLDEYPGERGDGEGGAKNICVPER